MPILATRFDRNTKHVFRRDDEPHHIQFASHRERDAALNIRAGRITVSGYVLAAFLMSFLSSQEDSFLAVLSRPFSNPRFPVSLKQSNFKNASLIVLLRSEKILELVPKTVELTAFQSVFLVGGFSTNTWLFEKVQKAIEPLGIGVFRPDGHV